ncbi:UNVERIFIED_CONTAM: hypothetical protein RMT77_001594 [Armadillidium vulgare]
MFECMCFPSVMYECETWMVNAQVKKRLNVFEMKGLRAICGLRREDKIRNERIREICGWRRGLVDRAKESKSLPYKLGQTWKTPFLLVWSSIFLSL